MKLNIYSFIVFGLILLILYPLIFYFSDKRINKANRNLLTYQYDVRGFLSVDNISEAATNMSRITENLNDKYFNNLPVVKFAPIEKFSTVQSYSVSEMDVKLLFDAEVKILRPYDSIKKNRGNVNMGILGIPLSVIGHKKIVIVQFVQIES